MNKEEKVMHKLNQLANKVSDYMQELTNDSVTILCDATMLNIEYHAYLPDEIGEVCQKCFQYMTTDDNPEGMDDELIEELSGVLGEFFE